MAKIISTNSTIYIPTFTGNYTKEISVLVFYPGIAINGKTGKFYMPSLILGAVPDWEMKYVIVIPNTDLIKWNLIKDEYTTELTKVGLVEKDLSIGLYSQSTGAKSDVLAKLPTIKILNLMLMDPISIGDIISIVKKVKLSGTICYLTYNLNNYSGYKNVLVKDYSDLVKAVGDNVVNTKSTTNDQLEIPTKFLTKWRDSIEKTLTSPSLTDLQPNEVTKSSDPDTTKILESQSVTETNVLPPNKPEITSNPQTTKLDLEISGIDTSKNVVVNAKQEMSEFTIYVGGQSQFSESFLKELDPEYSESEYAGSEEETVILESGQVMMLFNNAELNRNDNDVSDGDGYGVQIGGSLVVQPGGNVSSGSITIPSDLSGVKNSSVLKNNLNKDIVSPNGSRVTSEDLYRSMNHFIRDVLGPFATFLKNNYPDLYKKWYITSATRNYVPPGGSTTSQHMKGQAIDSQITGYSASNPDGNIRLLNAILTWYQNNPVGYSQILFETRGNSCWIHWAYYRGNTRLMLARFKDDKTYKSSANKTGSYLKPPVSARSLGF
jgi:hypothetical protein